MFQMWCGLVMIVCGVMVFFAGLRLELYKRIIVPDGKKIETVEYNYVNKQEEVQRYNFLHLRDTLEGKKQSSMLDNSKNGISP